MNAHRHVWILGCLANACGHNTTPVGERTLQIADAGTPDSGGTVRTMPDASPNTSPDAGVDCAQRLADMLAAPIIPNTHYAGLDLSSGANPKGLTIEEANADGCGRAIVESQPSDPGYRRMVWGSNEEISIEYNADSHVIYHVSLDHHYRGTVQFQSRTGGAFGSHSYEIGVGFVHRDGLDFPLDLLNGQTSMASASTNELYDGLMATFMPGTPAVFNCGDGGKCYWYDIPQDHTIARFGARPLHFYVDFDSQTNHATRFFEYWPGGTTDCSTPNANLERMDESPILDAYLVGIGGLPIGSQRGMNPAGMTWQEADAIECSGTQVSPADVGYGAIQWGPMGEVELEYNLTTNLSYKLLAKEGYRGTLTASSADGLHGYEIAIGSIAKDGAPFTIDWSNATATNRAVTELFNAAAFGVLFGAAKTSTVSDCVASGDCTFTRDDGHGHSTFELKDGSSSMGFVCPLGTSGPSTIYTTWANGR
jgi:hypothetical protein